MSDWIETDFVEELFPENEMGMFEGLFKEGIGVSNAPAGGLLLIKTLF